MVFNPNPNGPRGFDVVKGRDGTPNRSREFRIDGAYGTKLYTGQPVTLNPTTGLVEALAAAADPVLGVFDGCEYVDTNGDIRFFPYWPAPGAVKANTVVKARVYVAEEGGLFLIQANGAVTQAQIGDYADLTAIVGGNDVTGRADAIQLDQANTDNTLQTTNVVQILEVSPREEGSSGAPGTLAVVQFVRPQFAADVA